WSSTASSPWTTNVIRDTSWCSVSPTARLSMLNPRDASMPEMWASTPGWFWTRAESKWRMGKRKFPGETSGSMIGPVARPGDPRSARRPVKAVWDDQLADGEPLEQPVPQRGDGSDPAGEVPVPPGVNQVNLRRIELGQAVPGDRVRVVHPVV